ncbi:MAG: hypothetical protein ACK5NA_08240 [Enterococcus sp.]
MDETTKTIYFIEETQKIEGSYIEVRTLFVNEDKEQAVAFYHRLAKKADHFGLVLSEYKIKAQTSSIYQLLKRWAQLPTDFYRNLTILNYKQLAEYCY